MDVFLVYLFVATATPLFLWVEHRKWAVLHIPFVIALWSVFIYYVAVPELGGWGHVTLWSLFVANLAFAHIAAFMLYAVPFIQKQRKKKSSALKNF
ncbi:spore morphogenesis/germination protein YwcE [Rossellomorea vietnamensis]|uniref:Spore morphogenesis/germination protein YwcE n=1 Tax=Rossellomorea vietnamensis TaxID=218284 RepID=A0ACD4C5U6_9BACI|nr:spore morphogenesis/germination protein YwcE [Rossellomorea vietnamensis]UXH43706.1 spore morphogenesis/germination protein YwcE [Rossellomorea vietnamensis]WQI95065.1 spore morphogenesis/germination protein YwcE [Rossellomorea vietnamensis]